MLFFNQWFGSFFLAGTKVPEFIGFHCNPSLKAGVNTIPDIIGLQPRPLKTTEPLLILNDGNPDRFSKPVRIRITMAIRAQKYIFVLFFIFCNNLVFAQSNETKSHGTIKISKAKSDSIYIKAEMNFQLFQEGNKNTDQPIIMPDDRITVPFPKISGYSIPFDYNLFCTRNIEITRNDLGSKTTDTIRIQIKVLNNGKAYYKDVTPLMVLNGVPAYYDKKMNAYQLDAIHWKCLNVLKFIKHWESAYIVVAVKDTFKKVTVIKPKKKNLCATGILTIIFSNEPFGN